MWSAISKLRESANLLCYKYLHPKNQQYPSTISHFLHVDKVKGPGIRLSKIHFEALNI